MRITEMPASALCCNLQINKSVVGYNRQVLLKEKTYQYRIYKSIVYSATENVKLIFLISTQMEFEEFI